MNAKNISLTLAAMVALSTTAAFADDVVGTAVNTTANVVAAPIRMTDNLVHSIFHPVGPWFDLSVMGKGIEVGGSKTIITPAVSDSGMQILTNSAVIPGSVVMGRATAVQEILPAPKPMFQLGVFGFGIKAGAVNPRLDMR